MLLADLVVTVASGRSWDHSHESGHPHYEKASRQYERNNTHPALPTGDITLAVDFIHKPRRTVGDEQDKDRWPKRMKHNGIGEMQVR